MDILVLASSNIGTKTEIAANNVYREVEKEMTVEDTLTQINLKNQDMVFSDGRNYLDYPGDTGDVLKSIMHSDVIIIGTPIFQASIPASLKNIFDLLPQNALEQKTVSIFVTSGSDKHFLAAEQQLKPILSYMKANIVPNYVYLLGTDFDGKTIHNDDVLLRINTLVEDTLILARTYGRIWEDQEASYGF